MKIILLPLLPWSGPQSFIDDSGVKSMRTLPTNCASGSGPIELGSGIFIFGRSFLNPPCMDVSASHFALHVIPSVANTASSISESSSTSASSSLIIERISDKAFVFIELNGSTTSAIKLTAKGQQHPLNIGDVIRWGPNYRLRVEQINFDAKDPLEIPLGISSTSTSTSKEIEVGGSSLIRSSQKRPRDDPIPVSLTTPSLRPTRHHILLLPLLSLGRDYSASIEDSTTQLLASLNKPIDMINTSIRARTALSLSLFNELLHIIVIVTKEQYNADKRLQHLSNEGSSFIVICGDILHPFSDESTRQAIARSCNGLDTRDIISGGGISALVCRSNRRYLCERSFDNLTSSLFVEAKGEIPRPSLKSGSIASISTSRTVSCSIHAETTTSYIQTQGLSHIVYSVCPSFIPNRPNTPTSFELKNNTLYTLLHDSYINSSRAIFEEITSLAEKSLELSQVETDTPTTTSSILISAQALTSKSSKLSKKITATLPTQDGDSKVGEVTSISSANLPLSSPLTVSTLISQPASQNIVLLPSLPPPLSTVLSSSSSTSSVTVSSKTFEIWETPSPEYYNTNFRVALFEYAKNPSSYSKIIRYEDSNCVIISDRFPKAQLHFLLLAKPSYLNNVLRLTELKQSDVYKLDVLYQTAKAFALNAADAFYMYCKSRDRQSGKGPLTMNIGLHMLPSLEPLHIHIISDDFCSVHVKTKRQYNSFASDFFYKLDELVQSLKEIGDLAAEINPKMAQRQLDKELKCGKCGYGGGTMTEFKEHLETHLQL
jgi:aprataxin